MISDKQFSVEEFANAIPQFAQALINKIAERREDVKVRVQQEGPFSYLITIEKGQKDSLSYSEEYYSIVRHMDGHVESTSVYMR